MKNDYLYSQENIVVAKSILQGKLLDYSLRRDDVHRDLQKIEIENLEAIRRNPNIDFRSSNPMYLPADVHNFDLVILNDIIDKLPSPDSLLGRLINADGLVKPGGAVLIWSTNDWRESRTPRSHWLGDGDGKTQVDDILKRSKGHLELLASEETPVFWLESTFKFHGKVFQVSMWQRK